MSQPTVLIVEDNAMTRKLVRVVLTAEGYAVLEAPDGRTALELMSRAAPDLILQDLMLPDIDGFDLVGRLRALPGGADLPIIAFSGFLSRLESSRAVSIGFTDFLVKPVQRAQLTQMVHTYVGTIGVEPPSDEVGSRRILLVDDDPIGLKLAQTRLRQHGFTVVTATDGAEALEIARLSPPDVILSDVLMPRLDGFQLCATVRADPRLTHVPVVLWTAAYVEESDRRLAERSGASTMVVRTPGMEEAVHAVLTSLEVPVGPAPDVPADVLESERIHRVVRQLERQVSMNTGLIQRVSLQAALLSLVAGLPDSVGGAVDIETEPGEALAAVLDVAGVTVGAVYLLDTEGLLKLHVQLGVREVPARDAAEFFGHGELFELAMSSEHGLAIPSIAEPREAAGRDFLIRLGVDSALLVPLTSREDRLGILLLGSQQRDLTHPDWLAFVRSIGAQLGQTIVLSRAFARLSASERRYRTLFDSTPIGLFRTTQQGQFLEANPALVSLLGCPDRASLLAFNMDEFYVDLEDGRQFRSESVREATAVGFEVRLRRRDGAIIWVRVNSRLVRDADRLVYEGSVEDITERRRSEHRLAVEHAVTRALAESGGLSYTAPRILEALCSSFGWRLGELWRVDATDALLRRAYSWHDGSETLREFVDVGRDVTLASGVGIPGRVFATGEPVWTADVGHDPSLPGAAFALRAGLHGGFAFPVRLGREVLGVLSFFGEEIPQPDGDLLAMMASVAAQIAQGIARSLVQAEVERQREGLLQTEKLAAMGQLLAGVAHELNNPLSVVLGQAALLRHQVQGGPLDERAAKIAAAADRCARIVRNFLALARQRPAQRGEVDVNTIAREAAELLGYPLRVDSIEVTLDLGEGMEPLWADAAQLHQVIVNLVTNAHHALRQRPLPRQITIATRADPRRGVVTLAVGDNGPGIPPGIRTRIFEPFFTTKMGAEGTGLGLFLCQGIVEAHGGFITLVDRPAGGAAFRVELPVQPMSAPGVADASRGEETPITGQRILVVDDDEEVSVLLTEILAVDHHEVETAKNGAFALQMMRGQSYDLVVSDLRMPEMDGPELYRVVEAEDPDLARKFVFITGDTLGPAVQEFLERVRRPTLTKPFDFDEILHVIRRALRSVGGAEQPRTGG